MPTARLDQQFPFNADDEVLINLRRLVAVMEARFSDLEAERLGYTETVGEILTAALARVNEVLLPNVVRLQSLAALGFLLATSSSSVSLALGSKTFVIDAGNQRELFTPSPYVVIERVGSQTERAVARRLSYDQGTGVLVTEILVVFGATGPHSDWVISGSAGVSEISRLAWEGSLAAQTAAETAAAAAVPAATAAVAAAAQAVPAAAAAVAALTTIQAAAEEAALLF